jgi:hypothetical protein
MSQNWLPCTPSEIFCGCEYVRPPSVERANQTPLLPLPPTNCDQQT